MKYLLTILFIGLLNANLSAQTNTYPKVLNVSKSSTVLEELSADYKSSLFLASDSDVVKTMQNWKRFLVTMEKYAEEIDFNIKGVKVWIKVFWAENGTIDHLTYILSDTSINIDLRDLEAFFRSFIKNYKLPISYRNKFSYDARIMFPLYLMR
ncbi:hypothetical protein [Aureispira anguillae]|uniref:TonB C-terminal domain-containing protein n=1 Tax=Aureispira anguillae TaxID=2864201 RepID=A0A916DWH2_9BACT|nr:hypothetical protein [Aureispira anguillae]BDS14680.1 hypothetical protein AsAng_0054610 [Aureispira anguillae]